MQEKITLQVTDQIGLITINRPEALNAFNWAMADRFASLITHCQTLPLRALILTAVGRTFMAGGDITEQDTKKTTGERLAKTMGDALRSLSQLPYPTIAAIQADAYGGGWETITACDLRIMAETASLHFVQAKMGLTSGWGGTPRLLKLVGASRTSHWLLTAQSISAKTASEAGLIHTLVPKELVLTEAHTLAARISQLSPQALTHLKSLIASSTDTALKDAYLLETTHFLQAYTHPDHGEAISAFLEKRSPHYPNKD